jgi:hypothetical protein
VDVKENIHETSTKVIHCSDACHASKKEYFSCMLKNVQKICICFVSGENERNLSFLSSEASEGILILLCNNELRNVYYKNYSF